MSGDRRYSGWFPPVGLAGIATYLSCAFWIALLLIYTLLVPEPECFGRSSVFDPPDYAIYIALAISFVLPLTLTFLTAVRLGIHRVASVAITTVLLLPIAPYFAVVALAIVNDTSPSCD